jgi:hypothetical protein
MIVLEIRVSLSTKGKIHTIPFQDMFPIKMWMTGFIAAVYILSKTGAKCL